MTGLSNPVIVIPGITANYLRDDYTLPPDTVWSVLTKAFEWASLHPDNVRYEALEPARVRPDQLFEVVYKDLIEELRHDLSPTQDQPVPVYPFAYDWRLPVTHNAALLQKLGYAQLHSGNQLIAELAQEMIDAGVHVRLYSFMGLIVLHLRNALSWIPLVASSRSIQVQHLVSSSLIPAYGELKDKAGNLACLKFSSFHETLAQSL